MKIQIEIDTSNDAFHPYAVREVGRILSSEIQKMKIDGLVAKSLRDANGNVIGSVKIISPEEEGEHA